MPKLDGSDKARSGTARKRQDRAPGLIRVAQRRPEPLVATAAPSTSDVLVAGTSAAASAAPSAAETEETLSETSLQSHHTLPIPASSEDAHISMPRSVSAGTLDTQGQLERLLLQSLDSDDQRKAKRAKRATWAAPPREYHVDDSPDSESTEPEAHGSSEHDDGGGGATRHVYFDERMLHRQSSRQFWHHEARQARRAAFHPGSPHLDKRQAMEALMHRLQAQIEDAGNMLRHVPPNEWPFGRGSGSSTPYSEVLGYEVRRTLRPRPSIPVWEERPKVARPLRVSLRLTLEAHAPFFSASTARAPESHGWLAGVVRDLVQNALAYRVLVRSGAPADGPRVNVVLAALPTRALVWMSDVLHAPSTRRAYPPGLAPALRSHRPLYFQAILMQITVPTFLLHRANMIFATVLELTLVLTQLLLCLLLAGVQHTHS